MPSHTHDRHDGHSHTHDAPPARGAHGHSHTHGGARGHGHSHHGHAHGEGDWRRLATVLVLTATFMVVEAVAGFLTNSLALISDAGHMLTDAAALGLALFALWFSRRAAPPSLTFGYLRFEILAALVNGIALLGITGYIFWEAWERIQSPPEVHAGGMLVVAILGLAVNMVSLWILTRGGGHSLNERGAILHVLGDVLGSVGAITAALVIRFTGWHVADPIVSAVIGLLILRSTWELLREVVNILMEGTPIHLSFEEVHQEMLRVHGVTAVNDLHMWSLASGFDALSAHVVIPETARAEEVRRELKCLLRDRFGIRHSTLELHGTEEPVCCPPGIGVRCGAWRSE